MNSSGSKKVPITPFRNPVTGKKDDLSPDQETSGTSIHARGYVGPCFGSKSHPGLEKVEKLFFTRLSVSPLRNLIGS